MKIKYIIPIMILLLMASNYATFIITRKGNLKNTDQFKNELSDIRIMYEYMGNYGAQI